MFWGLLYKTDRRADSTLLSHRSNWSIITELELNSVCRIETAQSYKPEALLKLVSSLSRASSRTLCSHYSWPEANLGFDACSSKSSNCWNTVFASLQILEKVFSELFRG